MIILLDSNNIIIADMGILHIIKQCSLFYEFNIEHVKQQIKQICKERLYNQFEKYEYEIKY